MKFQLIIFFVFLYTNSFCQEQPIEVRSSFGGYDYTYEGKALSMKGLVSILKTNQDALPIIKSARKSNTMAIIFGTIGSSFIVYHIVLKTTSNESSAFYPFIGINVLALTIPFTAITIWKTKKAVQQYNSDLNRTIPTNLTSQIKFVSDQNGLGIQIQF